MYFKVLSLCLYNTVDFSSSQLKEEPLTVRPQTLKVTIGVGQSMNHPRVICKMTWLSVSDMLP